MADVQHHEHEHIEIPTGDRRRTPPGPNTIVTVQAPPQSADLVEHRLSTVEDAVKVLATSVSGLEKFAAEIKTWMKLGTTAFVFVLGIIQPVLVYLITRH